MFVFTIFGSLLSLTSAYFQIDDIPIEHFNFEHGDLQNNAMDIELMLPRFQKSLHIAESGEDPKEYFFRNYMQYGDSYSNQGQTAQESSEESDERSSEESKERYKREAVETVTESAENDRKSIVTTLGKPLELDVIDPENITTEKTEDGVIVAVENDNDNDDDNINFVINDFIRFKRAASSDRNSEDVENVKKLMKDIDEKNKSKPEPSENPKSLVEELQPPRTEKLVMNHREGNEDDDALRETRGATKDQWVKQVYPVRRREELEDRSGTSTEKDVVRPPRVHFVTQGMAESQSRPEYNRYDREARSRNLNKELAWQLGRDPYREMEYDYQPRYTRHYAPTPSHSNYRDDRYYKHDPRDAWYDNPVRSRYRDYPEKSHDNFNNYNNYSGNKNRQRRIIYYATLPEIARGPPSANFRDRYDFRDRPENKYFSPEPSYPITKPYTPYSKSRYEENDSRKQQYPLKVSTDVNVREVKKNPEGRIYSEVDRNRFNQNSNYRNDRV